MVKEKIELYKARDLGDRINVTFQFIKQNGKHIARNFLYLIPIFIIAAILSGISQGAIYSNTYYGFDPYSSDLLGIGSVGLLFLSIIVIALTSYVGILFVIAYTAEYEESVDGIVDNSKAWSRVRQSFWGGTGGSILVSIAVTIGTIFCILPGIWLGVSLSLFLPIYIIERNKDVAPGIFDSINDSFNLVKSDWFGSFGYFFIMGCISGAFYLALYVPTVFVNMLYFLIPNGGVFVVILSSFTYSLYYVGILFVYAITAAATVMLYFDLKERKEGLSLQKKIENIGQTEL